MADDRAGRGAWSWLLAGCVAVAVGCAEPARPNLLLVTIDTLRRDHTSAYGYVRDTTPVLRELAYAGVRFEDAYAPAATTAPTHASIFTGLHPVTHRVVKNGIVLPEAHTTLAERLADAGYQNAAITSSFVLHGKFGFERGFEEYQDDFEAEKSTLRSEGRKLSFDRRGEETTDRAIRWLAERRDPARPFFLFVHYFDPHAPYQPPWPFDGRFGSGEGMGVLENEVRLYDAEILYTDHQLGRLLEALDDANLTADTLVVVTSDHGEGLMDHGHMRHGLQVYEESVQVPLVMRWPGRLTGGRSIAGPVELVDLAPTLLELAGVPAAASDFAGRSHAGVLRGDGQLDPERPVHLFRRHYRSTKVMGFDVAGEGHAVVRGGWKYIEAPGEGRRELYDLTRDPRERVNRAKSDPERAEALSAEIAEFRRLHERAEAPPRVAEEDRGALEALGYVE